VGPRMAKVGATIVIALVAVIALTFADALTSVRPQGQDTCSPSASASTTTTSGSVPYIVSVSIVNGASTQANNPGYSPDSITLVMGVNNTMTWTNDDSSFHTVSSSSAPACGSFDSGRIDPDYTWTHTFTIPGSYRYYCKYHSWMKGTIVVESGAQ
jgi:plastocyanin